VAPPRIILALFLLTQAYDGLFTYAGVHAYGPVAEGNALIATWMVFVGPLPAIVGAKIVATACGVVLYCLGIRRTLLGLTVLYGVAAIGPWLIVLRNV
jgi:hypothetical protein